MSIDDYIKGNLTREEKAFVHDKIYFGHDKCQIINLAKRHGIYVARSWTNGHMADVITNHLNARKDLDAEVIKSIVTTESSYLEVPDAQV